MPRLAVCQLCDGEYPFNDGKMKLCPACITDDNLYEAKHVMLNRSRASSGPATLTLSEWLYTLNHFNHRCAYCLTGPYEYLEHFIPLSYSSVCIGGTTAQNCIPACAKCNAKKRDVSPEQIINQPELFSHNVFPNREMIVRISDYLRVDVAYKASHSVMLQVSGYGGRLNITESNIDKVATDGRLYWSIPRSDIQKITAERLGSLDICHLMLYTAYCRYHLEWASFHQIATMEQILGVISEQV